MNVARPFEISKTQVWLAYQSVKANGGSAGVDQVEMEEFESSLKNNLYKIWSRMSSGTYFPPAVKAVPIPKKSGGVRILGIPTISDRIAQTVVKMVLSSHYWILYLMKILTVIAQIAVRMTQLTLPRK